MVETIVAHRSTRTTFEQSPRTTGRRKSDRAPLPDWLPAVLLDDEDPRDGDLIDPSAAEPGDYWFEFHEGDGTASWLRITGVEAGSAETVLTVRGAVVLGVPAGREVWILRRAAAAVLARGSSDRVLHAWGAPENEMQAFLRECRAPAEVFARWKFVVPSAADALVAWYLLREADEANSMNGSATVLAGAR